MTVPSDICPVAVQMALFGPDVPVSEMPVPADTSASPAPVRHQEIEGQMALFELDGLQPLDGQHAAAAAAA